MAELCLMAAHGYPPPPLFFNQDHCVTTRLIKDCQPFWLSAGARQDTTAIQNQRPEPLTGLSESIQRVKIPIVIDIQDAHPTSQLCTFEKFERNTNFEEVWKLSMQCSSDLEKARDDPSRLSNLVDIIQVITSSEVFSQTKTPSTPSLIYPRSSKFDSHELPLLDFVGELARNSNIIINPDGRIEFTGSRTEMKDLLSIVAEFYLTRNTLKWERHTLPIPHFTRLNIEEARTAPLKVEAATIPLKSPEKVKVKKPRKKGGRRVIDQERDLYKRNYFHACESLLSLMMDKRQQGKMAILSLKKVGPELPELLNQFSAGIAGTGITVVLSVMLKVAGGRVPFCASKLMNTGFGVGLVWLSWAVNKLSSTVIDISRNGGKSSLNDVETMERVDKGMKEIYFRAATVMVVAVLRFA